MFDLGICRRLLPRDVDGLFNFLLEACGSRVEDFKTTFWAKGATNSEPLRCLKMCKCLSSERRSQMCGEVSVEWMNEWMCIYIPHISHHVSWRFTILLFHQYNRHYRHYSLHMKTCNRIISVSIKNKIYCDCVVCVVSPRKRQLHWQTLSSRRSYHKAKFVFLCLHSLVPSYFHYILLDFRTFLFTGAKIFNNLPLTIVESENIQMFSCRARHFFLW